MRTRPLYFSQNRTAQHRHIFLVMQWSRSCSLIRKRRTQIKINRQVNGLWTHIVQFDIFSTCWVCCPWTIYICMHFCFLSFLFEPYFSTCVCSNQNSYKLRAPRLISCELLVVSFTSVVSYTLHSNNNKRFRQFKRINFGDWRRKNARLIVRLPPRLNYWSVRENI